jgi:hypothetical protein
VERAWRAIDAANAQDPVTVVVDGVTRPKELVHAERMTHWVRVLDPAAGPAQFIAARAHHLRRWVSPRSDFPDGRPGYLQWRTAHQRRQVDELRALLEPIGCPPGVVSDALATVAKDGLRRGDPAAQVHEDALCLVFLELQLEELADRLGEAHTVAVLRKSLAKMSPTGLATAGSVALSERGGRLLAAALADPA